MLESEQVSEHLIILLIEYICKMLENENNILSHNNTSNQYICKMLENENNILSHNNTSNSIHLLDARE